MKLTFLSAEPQLRIDTSVGVRVFAGDQMIFGDTGVRKVEDLATGFDFSTAAHHMMTIRRLGDEITLEGIGVRSVLERFLTGTLPLGFRPKTGEYRGNRGFAQVGSSQVPLGNANTLLCISNAGNLIEVGALVEFSVKWTTADAWPSSRPGTP